jgi:flagellar assembly protein FliH
MTAQIIPHEKLTAYQRWELAALNEDEPLRRNVRQAKSAMSENKENTLNDYDAGFAVGHKQGRTAVESSANQLSKLLNSANEVFNQIEEQLTAQILDLAIELARHVLRGELTVRRDAIVPVVSEAIQALPISSTQRKLLLNPSDSDIVRAHLGDEITLGGWQMIEDHLIEPGGCRIVASNGDIDATLATRWKNAVSALDRTDAWHDA